VLCATGVLILGGALAIFALEYENPLTMGDRTLFEKLQISFFQSVTTRTAGFATVPQENLTAPSALVCLFLMFIGGSSAGTAGGIKTTTLVVLLATAYATVRNKEEVSVFGRNLTEAVARKAVAVMGMSFLISFVSSVLLSIVADAPTLDVLYETISATATVGLTRNLTPFLNSWGKMIVICTMYFGRIGPVSLAIAFRSREKTTNIIKNPTEEICVG
jgi:trk system potassium uptake protein TrkH